MKNSYNKYENLSTTNMTNIFPNTLITRRKEKEQRKKKHEQRKN